MAACPVCGERVPFGGGRTVKNAHVMFELGRRLSRLLKPGDEYAEASHFLTQGSYLAKDLHNYGHKYSTTNPDWATAGEWTRQAQEMVRNLGGND